jgi:asparagine synthetase B (glutamine-hydrolysing)
VDSSYLQALLCKEQQTHSFSIAFDKYGRDNVYAADVAEYLRTSHEAITLTADEFLQYLERGIKLTARPHMYQGEAMFLKLYEHIATRFPNATIVSGQTADGAFDSAPPRPIQMALRFGNLPRQLLDVMLSYITDEWCGLAAGLQAANISSDSLRRIERRSGICQKVAGYLGFAHDVFSHTAEMANWFAGDKEDKLAKAHLYSGEMRRIPNMLHALTEAVGLVVVFPFLDPTFLEYTLTIPATLKRRKYLGKKLAERYISHRYVHRPKIAKNIPFGTLFTEAEQWVELLNVIKKVGYYGFDVNDMIANREYALVLRLINFHLWNRNVLNPERGRSGGC